VAHVEPDDRWYHWSQHGYEFRAHIYANFPEEGSEALTDSLLNAQPVIAWELQGNAVSVSVQGVKSITISSETRREVISTPTVIDHNFGNVFISLSHALDHHTIYIDYDGELTRIGYSWLVDTDLARRQFVLEPGTYTFHVEGVIGEPDLLIRHFRDREIVSSVSYGEELSSQAFSSFTISVTSDYSGNSDAVEINTAN